MANPRNLVTRLTIQNLIAENNKVYATQTALGAVSDKVTTLIGSDEAKSVRTIANEELAAQLIPANAGEALDTLQEIAAWIQAHPGDASAMNAAIAALQTKTTLGKPAAYVAATGTAVDGTTYYADANGTALDSQPAVGADVSSYFVVGPEYATVKAYVEAYVGNAIANADLSQYATNASVESDVSVLQSQIDDLATATAVTDTTVGDGKITIGDTEYTVYTLPDTVLHDADIVDYTAQEIAALITPPAQGGGGGE